MMQSRVPALLFTVSLCTAAFGQIPARPASDEVVRISTNLIQIDVTVTGKNGEPVRDLVQDEVEIYENGKLQKISNFSFIQGRRVDGGTAVATGPLASERKSGVVLPGPPPRPEQVRRTIAVVVDDLNLSFGSVVWVKDALKKFVREQVQDGDLVAIIRTGAGMGALQQFTTDRRQLLAVADRVKYNAYGNGGLSYFNPISESTTNEIVTAAPSGDPPPQVFDISGGSQASPQDMATRFDEFRENIFAGGTLGALNFIVRGMKELPGRKSVIFLSDGLPVVTRAEDGRPRTSQIFHGLQRLIDLASRASVVFYTVHAAGLDAPTIGAADEVGGIARIGGERVTSNIVTARMNRISDSQEGLRYLADETGGLAYINQNDISKGMRRALDDQSYYLIAYEPDEDTFDAKASRYNKFEIKVKRPGTKVRYRSGFYSFAEEQVTPQKLTAADSIANALTSPFALKDIDVRMNALFTHDQKDGSYIRAFLNVDGSDITFTRQPDGRYKCSLDVVAFTFGDNGVPIDERSKNITLSLDEKDLARFLQRGLVSSFSLPVKKPGAYQVRLAIRDSATERLGSANQFVEVPDVKKNNLLISGIVLENLPVDRWRTVYVNGSKDGVEISDPQRDTSVREFAKASVLRFGYQIYNARNARAGLFYRLRLYHQNTPIYESPVTQIRKLTEESPRAVSTSGAVLLRNDLSPGDYILQIDIFDGPTNQNRRATQFVQFEIVD